MFPKTCSMESTNFSGNGGAVLDVLYENNLQEIYKEVSIYLKYYKPHSLFKNSENVVKSGCFEKCLRWRASFFPK